METRVTKQKALTELPGLSDYDGGQNQRSIDYYTRYAQSEIDHINTNRRENSVAGVSPIELSNEKRNKLLSDAPCMLPTRSYEGGSYV